MQQELWPAHRTAYMLEEHERSDAKDLRRIASGGMPLPEAFLVLTYQQEEQARRSVELLERETWVVTAILKSSAPIWSQLAQPTLSFPLRCPNEPSLLHLEVGTFAHLAALDAPSPGEQALIAACEPCWALVYRHHNRTLAGHTGVMACSYVPIPVTKAVALLGMATIMTRIEAATRAAGRALLEKAADQDTKQARLLEAEQALGWGPNPALEPREEATPDFDPRIVALLSRQSGAPMLLGAAGLGLLTMLVCLFGLMSLALVVLTFAISGILIWSHHVGS